MILEFVDGAQKLALGRVAIVTVTVRVIDPVRLMAVAERYEPSSMAEAVRAVWDARGACAGCGLEFVAREAVEGIDD